MRLKMNELTWAIKIKVNNEKKIILKSEFWAIRRQYKISDLGYYKKNEIKWPGHMRQHINTTSWIKIQ